MNDSAKLTIYGRKNSINVMKVTWCSTELGLPFERIDVGGPFAFENVPDYLSLNPSGLIPTIRDGELLLWESNVIVRYLCSQYGQGKLWPAEGQQRWQMEAWMDWMQTALIPHLSTLLIQMVRTPPEQQNPQAIENARLTLTRFWPILDAHLAERQYIGGDTFGMGDIPLGAAVHRWYAFNIQRPALPHLEAWYQRLLQRDAYQEHVDQPLS